MVTIMGTAMMASLLGDWKMNNCQRTCRKASQTFMSQTRWKAIQRFFCFVCATIYFFSLSLTLIVWNYMTSTLFVKTLAFIIRGNMTLTDPTRLHLCYICVLIQGLQAWTGFLSFAWLVRILHTHLAMYENLWEGLCTLFKKKQTNLYNIFKSKIKHL